MDSKTTVKSADEDTTIPEQSTNTPLEEGDCSKDGIIYMNNTNVPPSVCDVVCHCENGAISCEKLACPVGPAKVLECETVNQEGMCCPTYNCRECLLSTVFTYNYIYLSNQIKYRL